MYLEKELNNTEIWFFDFIDDLNNQMRVVK
jgi:hypothetical protein